ncbi:MAG: SMC family ATPase [Acidimicrobiaceae bacterium]|nr:SMC family ATPase [Acidimicrobiaceae bacterium]
MRPLKLRMKGFSAFREETEVDFEGVELAALVGHTGSGKSTIIDGITFALFGSVARYDNTNLVAPVISQLEHEARVTLEFEVSGQRYTAVRVVRRTASGATTKEARLEYGERVLAGQAREMAPAVEALLGLDFDRFTKTVVLPQGRFARFLHDDDSKRPRHELLRHLLNLGIYTGMGEEARRRAGNARALLGELERQLEADAPTEEQVAELAARAEAATAAQAKLEGVSREIAELEEGRAEARLEVERFDKLLRAASAATVPDAVRELALNVEEARRVFLTAETEHSERRTDLDEANSRALDGPNVEVCRNLLKDYERLGELEGEIEDLDAGEADAERSERAARESAEQADDALSSATEALDRVKAVKSAEVLVAQLEVGEPCPVCLQPVVDLPAHDIDAELEQALAAQERSRRQKEVSDERLAKANQAFAEAKALHAAKVQQRTDLADRLSDAPDEAALLADIDAALGLAKTRSLAEAAEAEAHRHVKAVKEDLNALEAQEHESIGDYSRVRDSLAELAPPGPSGSLLTDWETLAVWAEDQQGLLVKQRASAEASRQGAEARRREVVQGARELCAPYFEPGADPQRYDVEMALAVQRAAAAHAQAERERRSRAALEQRVAEVRAEESVASELGRLLSARGFERWVMQEAVASLVERANERLLQLSHGQYSFEVDSMVFDIRDHYNADEVRRAKTLSGGETFLASLALALALSDSQAEMSSEDSPGLESLFLDEGFGTLDPDALAGVAAALTELGATGRMVCIVTHIRELADEMPVRFEVSRGPVSSSVERVEA